MPNDGQAFNFQDGQAAVRDFSRNLARGDQRKARHYSLPDRFVQAHFHGHFWRLDHLRVEEVFEDNAHRMEKFFARVPVFVRAWPITLISRITRMASYW
jgi:hypothetical protein